MKNEPYTKQSSLAAPVPGKGSRKVIRTGIIGGAGYTGGELIRILLHHPLAEIAFVHSKSNAGKYIHEVHTDLIGETDIQFSDELLAGADVWFLCVGHGEAKQFVEEQGSRLQGVHIIDLSQDYRLHSGGRKPVVGGHPFVYGLPELNRAEIRGAFHVANPGCFATAIQLGLLPLAKAGLLHQVHTTGITGSTGAGQGLAPTSHFSWRANNIQAYKTLTHQHLREIYQSLNQLQETFPDSPGGPEDGPGIRFIPWRGDFTRGIFASSQIHCDWKSEDLTGLYQEFYRDHPFTVVSTSPIHLKQAVNTNKCVIQLEKVGTTMLVVHAAVDNLLKGASGQAVQNMNLMFGIEETAGLKLKPAAF
jgi:N-acetyl-gamma-glutamyl-phosphate reductase